MPSLTRAVAVPGGSLHTVVDGEGPPILLVHAGIVDLRAWDPLVPFLVDAGYRAVRYDTRAFGRSTTEDVDFSNRADLRAVLDAFGIGRAAFVGNSRGAMIALDTILESPERAVAFAFLAVVGGLDTSDTQAAARRLEEAVPGARRVVIPDVAHMVGMEAPDRLADLIVDLLRPLGNWA